MESEVFDFRISTGAFQRAGDCVLVYRLAIVARENKSVDVPDLQLLSLAFDLIEDLGNPDG
jgi:hypothetical protein